MPISEVAGPAIKAIGSGELKAPDLSGFSAPDVSQLSPPDLSSLKVLVLSSTSVGDGQNCAAVCLGGSIDGYSGDFWVDLECDSEYAFCCDESTFVYDAGTPAEDSFLASLSLVPPAAPPPPSSDARDFPVSERHLCFSTLLSWHDAQTMCESVGSNLITISVRRCRPPPHCVRRCRRRLSKPSVGPEHCGAWLCGNFVGIL